jgi:hypothetical protein
VQEFIGNKSAETLMEELSNFSAVRSLGQVDVEKLKTFELDRSKKTLTLVQGSTPRIFVIGSTTYGNMDFYIQDKKDGGVYVIRPRFLQDMRYADTRLMERKFSSFEMDEVERVTIATKTIQKTILQKNRRDPNAAYWVNENEPEKRRDFYRNWFEKIFRIRVMEYQASSNNSLKDLDELFKIEFNGDRKRLDFLKLYKKQTLIPHVAGSTEDGAGDYYAMTGETRVLVKISRPLGDEISRDLSALAKE